MAYNIFEERVEKFNLETEGKLLYIEKTQEDLEYETYTVNEIQNLLSLTEDEARKLMKSGLFKTYRVGNEYRAAKKSVKENQKVIKALMSYKNKKTMTVADMRRILGLGKTASYRLVNQCRFKTYLVLGKMRIDVNSFEKWYSGQFHYKKVNGERPGTKYIETIAPLTMAKVLGIPKSTAYDLMNNGMVDFILVEGKRRVIRESFEKWYEGQNHYKKIKEISEVE